jgi:AcrR family transcriptional regulator
MQNLEVNQKTRILDAAEELVKHGGTRAVTYSAVAAQSGLPELAVSEQFGTDQALIREMFSRKFAPLDRERLRLLSYAESMVPGGIPRVDCVLRAYMVPWVKFWQTSPSLLVAYARDRTKPERCGTGDPDPLEAEVGSRFRAALVRALPGLPEATLLWRLHFIKGAVLHTWADHEALERLSRGVCSMKDVQAVIDEMVAFAAAGLQAA